MYVSVHAGMIDKEDSELSLIMCLVPLLLILAQSLRTNFLYEIS
jgi:hypothetical protein